MKNGKAPTRGQKKIMRAHGLVPENWLVVKNLPDTLEVVSRTALKKIGRKPRTKTIFKLTQELGWDKPSRVNGMCRKMFGVGAVEWLDYQQCSKLIEALKSMAKRQKEGQDEGLQACDNGQ